MAERAVVLQVLRDDHPERWTQVELQREIDDIEPEVVESAIEDLASQGVVDLDDDGRVRASLCARRLDALRIIAI